MAYSKHYIIGASVGVAAQPSSIAVIEQESRSEGMNSGEVTELRLRHLERLPLDAEYPKLAKRLREIFDNLTEQDSATKPSLLVDVTGTGSSVVKYFQDETLSPIQVFITAGYGLSEIGPNKWRISKTELVGPLQVLLHTDKFRIANKLDLASPFKDELANYRPKAAAMNGNDIETLREGNSDDLVFAVALATWWGQRHVPMSKSALDEFDRMVNAPERTNWIV